MMKPIPRHKRLAFDRWFLVIAIAALFAYFPAPVLALPLDGQVTAGSGSITQSGSAMTVRQDTSKLSINWREFGIGANESMRFYQPSASAIALNRVLGQDPSRILGCLTANGQVFILNPNGVIFGQSAQVNVGGLVASSLSLSDQDFLAGRYTFQKGGIAGDVVNMGSLSSTEGGYIALLAPTVRNEGTITAPRGTVALAAGERITLNLNNGGLLNVAVEKSTFDALAENHSLIQADGGTILLSAGGRDAILDGIVNNTGVVKADSVSTGPGGVIRLESRLAVNTGTLSANGTSGGNISIRAHNVLQAGIVSANGESGSGGTVTVDADHRIIQTDPARITADGSTGGSVHLTGGQDDNGGAFISGKISAQGSGGKGGNITLTGADLTLAAADFNASGATQGGSILIGGDYQGKNPAIPNARNTYINSSSIITADATLQGDGGRVIVWSDEATTFGGSIGARGAGGGQGGFVEVSGHDLYFAGDVQAKTLLLDPANITISTAGSLPAFQLIDPNPANSNNFGLSILALSTGNVGVTSPYDDFGALNAGAVYLYNGTSGALISTLTGSTANDNLGDSGITALTGNGNYVVRSSSWNNGATTTVGAVTWGNGSTGVSGLVSAANSLIGSKASDQVGNSGVTALSNGNYVVVSSNWDNGATLNVGAVTWGNGLGGTVGAVSAANSLIGSMASDQVGNNGVTALTNGNYVVKSTAWDNGATSNVGAVTWGNGLGGTVGAVSAANSLIGSSANDQVGSGGVTALTNGNYVVSSTSWSNGALAKAGAVTWGNGLGGTVGAVSAANSLIGSSGSDIVGSGGITSLTNGNYVVSSPNWDNAATANVGAVTWGNGLGGTVGALSAANSLIGSMANDQVGSGGITALTNGNYVVRSSSWDNSLIAIVDAGAVTWGNGLGGTVGALSAANSLIGSRTSDQVGSGGITALTNGNYVVASPNWDSGVIANAGAVTWGNGLGGTVGAVSAANSLVGSSANDQVGSSITALTNGNYVVSSPNWDNGATSNVGAATWGNGLGGTVGAVSAANSLIGSSANDMVGVNGVKALTNGNYVVGSSLWDNGATLNVGASTWGNGLGGTVGVVSAANSLIGSTSSDQVGFSGVIALSNGNYVVQSPFWDNGATTDVGAVTWGNGLGGTVGAVTTANSLTGGSANDTVGISGVTALSNGNYLVKTSVWTNGVTANAGAVTLGLSTGGTVGAVSAANSLLGVTANDYLTATIAELPAGSNLVAVAASFYDRGGVDRGRVDILSTTGSMSYGMGQSQSVTINPGALTNVLNNGTAVILQASNDITLSSALTANNPSGAGGALTLQAGRSLLLNANLTTDDGSLTLIANDRLANGVVDAQRSAGAATITMAAGTAINAGSGSVTIDMRDGAGKSNLTSGNIDLRTINAGSISITNNGATAGSNVILNGVLTASGAGDVITVATAHNFVNNVGAGVYSLTGGGRWLTYLPDNVGNTLNALDPGNAKPNLYNCIYGGACGITVPATGNHFVYATQPLLTVTGDDKSKTYGAADPALTYNYNAANLINGDPDPFLSGALTAPTGAAATAGTHNITQGTVVSDIGYGITYNNGTLTVAKAPLTVTADDKSKTYGNADPALTYTVNAAQLQYTDTAAVVSGVALSTATGAAATAGTHTITAAGGTASNYTITDANGTLTVAKRDIIATGDNQSKTYGGVDPALTYSVGGGGLVYADTQASVFSGALSAPMGAAATAGTHNITQGTLAVTNSNYNLTGYNNGIFTVAKAPLTVTADDKSKVQGSLNPPFTANYSGFVYSETAGALGGALDFSTPATMASPAGIYTITPFGQISSNYLITYVNGILTVSGSPSPGREAVFTTRFDGSVTANSNHSQSIPRHGDILSMEGGGVRMGQHSAIKAVVSQTDGGNFVHLVAAGGTPDHGDEAHLGGLGEDSTAQTDRHGRRADYSGLIR